MSNDAIAAELAALRREVSTLRQELDSVVTISKEIRSLVGPFGVPMPDGSMLVQTLHGTKYLIDPSDHVIAPNLIVYRQWEADVSSLVRQLCTPDTVFVDVGASFGYFTCLAGSAIGTGGNGRVIAIEPNPAMVTLLHRNVDINWSMAPISIHDCAATDQRGKSQLFVPRDRASNATMVQAHSPPPAQPSEIVSVKTYPLDELVPSDVAVDVLKIDVEGHELSVLKGASSVIARSPNIHIIMEWSPGQMAAAGYSVDAMIALFSYHKLAARSISGLDPEAALGSTILTSDELRALSYATLLISPANSAHTVSAKS